MHVMKDMRLTEDETEKAYAVTPYEMSEKPQYPYGLRICLCGPELDKLDLDIGEAVIGGIIHLHAFAKITSVSADASEHGENVRVELQITDLEVESEDEENKEN